MKEKDFCKKCTKNLKCDKHGVKYVKNALKEKDFEKEGRNVL